MKLINNPFPLALLEVDVLKSGRKGIWNYRDIEISEDGFTGVMNFKQGSQSEAVTLA